MDSRLLEACQTGNTQLLHQLVAANPLTLHTVALYSPDNPLHVASVAGHADFAKEILRLKPDFALQLNHDGFGPIHMASANGYVEIVRELLKTDRRISRLEGKNKWTPLHFAASRGRTDVIREILLACPESIEDVNTQGETALHVAVKSSQYEAIVSMLTWVRDMSKDEILDMRDELGNSVLHLATWRKNRQVVEWLLENNRTTGSFTLVNGVNKGGLTPLDVLLLFPSEAGDREIEELLRKAGAKRTNDPVPPSHPLPFEPDVTPPSNCESDLEKYFKFKKGRDTPSDARTALLVMAVLMATATFQVGVNPPGGIWQDTVFKGNGTIPSHLAGRSILGSNNSIGFLIFVIFNSIGLSLSLYMLTILTSGFPMHMEFQICVGSLYFTYYLALNSMAPDGLVLFITVFAAVMPATIHSTVKLLRLLIKKLRWVTLKLYHCIMLFWR